MKKNILKIEALIIAIAIMLMNSAFATDTNRYDKFGLNVEKPVSEKYLKLSDNVKETMVNTFAKINSISFQEEKEVFVAKNHIEVVEKASDNTIKQTYIYAINDGKQVDMAELAKVASYNVIQYPVKGSGLNINGIHDNVDFSWTITLVYGRATNALDELGAGDRGYLFIRPTRVEGRWGAISGKNVTMSSFEVGFKTMGWLTISPDCLNSSLTYRELERLVVDEDYQHDIFVSTRNLRANTTIGKTSAIPSNRAVWIQNGLAQVEISIECDYICNGSSYTGNWSEKVDGI